jgi:predicted amidohydrolase YtcJ
VNIYPIDKILLREGKGRFSDLTESKGGTSRRGFVKYLLGFVAALAAAVVGYGVFTRKRKETPEVLQPSQTTSRTASQEPSQTTVRTVPEGPADTIFMNGNILTVDPNDAIVEAVAVKDGTIQAAGSYKDLEQLVGPSTKQVDLKGKTVTPGLVDSHLHMQYYGKQFQDKLIDIRFPTVKTREELIEKIRKRVETADKGKWVACNQGFIFSDPPGRWELDEIAPDNPVYILHASGQFAVANSPALKLAGIDKDTPNPYGGLIDKDKSTREPTGFLYHYPAIDLVRRLIPGIGDVTDEDRKGFVLTGANKCLEAGYTSVEDVIIASSTDVRLYKDMGEEGKLSTNVYMLQYVESLEDAKTELSRAEHWKGKNYNFGGWKIAVDGGASAGTALMYDRDTMASQRSYLYHTQETLNEIVAMFHDEGYQVAFHVVGDKAVDMALDAIEYALNKTPRADHRHRLEHVIIPTPEALDRIKKLGVVVSTSPQWITFFGAGWEGVFGEERMERFMPLKTMLDKGIHLAFGCDVPATPLIDPKWALIGATSRMTFDMRPIRPEQSISMKDTLRIHTMGSAYAAFEENIRGSIEPGKTADMVVWSEDLYSASLQQLVKVRVEATIVEGEIAYKAEDTTIVF